MHSKKTQVKKSLFIQTIILMFLGLIDFTASAQLSEKNYKIYSVKLGKEISLNEIVEDMNNYDVLFFGEEHNDSVGHYLENKLVELLYQKFNNKITLSLEMFERDVQPIMNEYVKGFIREKNFMKDTRTWSNYKDYKPMIEFAKKNKLDVICANAASRYTNIAGRKGQKALMELPNESKKYFAPLPYDTASGKYCEKLMALTHEATPTKPDTSAKKAPAIPLMGSYNLIMGQSLWDATMAYSIAEYWNKNKNQKIFQVNGRFHSDEKFAIVTQLKKYAPKIKSLVISSGGDDAYPTIDWNAHKHLGDYIIITDPSVPKTYKD